MLKIPVLPISYADAKPFLAALGGQVVPEDWRGALPFTYHIGPGPAKVHLKVITTGTPKPVYDVVAMIKGSELPGRVGRCAATTTTAGCSVPPIRSPATWRCWTRPRPSARW